MKCMLPSDSRYGSSKIALSTSGKPAEVGDMISFLELKFVIQSCALSPDEMDVAFKQYMWSSRMTAHHFEQHELNHCSRVKTVLVLHADTRFIHQQC